jgi:SET domain-containing protein
MPLSATKHFHIRDNPNEKGRGLFASKMFVKGEDIYPFDYWSKELMPIHVTNHSCNANATFNAQGRLVALRDIKEHEEITYDYLLHPIAASPWNFKCECKSDGCAKWVTAIKY